MSASAIAQRVSARDTTATSMVREALDAVAAADGSLNACTQILEEPAMARAAEIDDRIARGEHPGPLAGVPVAIKDNLCTTQGRTTCASRFLEHYRSPYTATAVERLEAAGAVVVCKANMDEFAMGSSGEHSAFGPTRNPWDTTRVPGGSSSGSTATVAAGLVPLALGSDTGGSIRQPASHCGVVGFKPTYGAISRYGLVAFASSLDQIGPLTRSVEDAAIALDVMRGHDPRDATSSTRDLGSCTADLATPLEGARIGVPRDVIDGELGAAMHSGVREAYDKALEAAKDAGAELVDVALPHADAGIAAYYIVAPAEASSNLARFDGARYGRRAEGDTLEAMYINSRCEGFGAEVRRRILLGTHALSSGYYDAYYTTALKARRLIKRDYDEAFTTHRCTAILMPAAPGPAFEIGAKSDDPLALYLEDVFTVGANLAGLPGITLPVTTTIEDGKELPIGAQLIGPAFEDARLLRLAAMLERSLDWGARVAP